MKAISSPFELVLFIMLCRVELPFESMDAILMSDQFKWKLLRSTFDGAVSYVVQGDSNF